MSWAYKNNIKNVFYSRLAICKNHNFFPTEEEIGLEAGVDDATVGKYKWFECHIEWQNWFNLRSRVNNKHIWASFIG